MVVVVMMMEGVGGDVQLSVFELWDSGKTMPAEP